MKRIWYSYTLYIYIYFFFALQITCQDHIYSVPVAPIQTHKYTHSFDHWRTVLSRVRRFFFVFILYLLFSICCLYFCTHFSISFSSFHFMVALRIFISFHMNFSVRFLFSILFIFFLLFYPSSYFYTTCLVRLTFTIRCAYISLAFFFYLFWMTPCGLRK